MSNKLPNRIIFGGLFKSWLSCLPFLAIFSFALAALLDDFDKDYSGSMNFFYLAMGISSIISFVLILVLGYVLFQIFEKKHMRKKSQYLIAGAIAGGASFAIFMPLSILASYVFWKTVTEKYLIKGQVYDRDNS